MSMDREILDSYRGYMEQGYRKLKPEFASFDEQDIIEDIIEDMWEAMDKYLEWITEEGE
jgi:hypothetical protein